MVIVLATHCWHLPADDVQPQWILTAPTAGHTRPHPQVSGPFCPVLPAFRTSLVLCAPSDASGGRRKPPTAGQISHRRQQAGTSRHVSQTLLDELVAFSKAGSFLLETWGVCLRLAIEHHFGQLEPRHISVDA